MSHGHELATRQAGEIFISATNPRSATSGKSSEQRGQTEFHFDLPSCRVEAAITVDSVDIRIARVTIKRLLRENEAVRKIEENELCA